MIPENRIQWTYCLRPTTAFGWTDASRPISRHNTAPTLVTFTCNCIIHRKLRTNLTSTCVLALMQYKKIRKKAGIATKFPVYQEASTIFWNRRSLNRIQIYASTHNALPLSTFTEKQYPCHENSYFLSISYNFFVEIWKRNTATHCQNITRIL